MNTKTGGIGMLALLYLAACWAPQLWTQRAEAQEQPAVLEELRARRIVLVDEHGEERAVLEVRDLGARLTLRSESQEERSVTLLGNSGLRVTREVRGDGDAWQEAASVGLSNSTAYGPTLAMVQREREPPSVRVTNIGAGALSVGRVTRTGDGSASMTKGVDVSDTAMEVRVQGKVVASVGAVESEAEGAGGAVTWTGTFTSSDADGSVRWIEPK